MALPNHGGPGKVQALVTLTNEVGRQRNGLILLTDYDVREPGYPELNAWRSALIKLNMHSSDFYDNK